MTRAKDGMMPLWRRRCYLIDRRLQIKYALLTLIVLMVQTLIVVVAIFGPSILTLSLDPPMPQKVEAARTLLLLHGNVWISIGAITLIFAVLSIFLSHRVAGPVFRIGKTLRQIADGDLTVAVKLRKGDEFHDLAEDLNTLTAKYRAAVAALKQNQAFLDEEIALLEAAAGRDGNTAGSEAVGRLKDTREEVQRLLDAYRT